MAFFKELFFKQGNFHMKIQILLFYDIRLWLVDNIVCNPKENSINITMFPFVLTTNIMLFSKNKFLSRLFDRYIDENKITSFDVALFWMINSITTRDCLYTQSSSQTPKDLFGLEHNINTSHLKLYPNVLNAGHPSLRLDRNVFVL